MGVGLNVWDVVINMFEGNQNLCEICPESLFVQFATMLRINHSKYSMRELDFFFNVIEPRRNFRAIKRSQNITISSLMGDKELEGTLIFHLESDIRREKLLSPRADSNVNNMKIAFHAKLMHLFAIASKDKNSFAASKLQAKVSERRKATNWRSVGTVEANTTLQIAHINVRRRFNTFSRYSVGSPKIDMLCCKLRMVVSRYKGALRPSSWLHYASYARPSAVHKAQHNTTPFSRRNYVFCREPKNRHTKLQTSNGRNFERP